jgi:signal transduction histidine kinase
MRRAADRLNELVSDMLDVSRIRTGRLDLELEPVDLAALAREVIERFEPLLTPPQTLRLRAPEAPLVGLWDRRRLDQILTNLISNALKYSTGPIDVRLRREGQSGRARAHPKQFLDGEKTDTREDPPARAAAHLTVRDRGIGFDPHDLPHLFDPFYRAAAARGSGGVGLGLYISREIALRLGGEIWAESPGAGKGSTFHLRLPLAGPSPLPLGEG